MKILQSSGQLRRVELYLTLSQTNAPDVPIQVSTLNHFHDKISVFLVHLKRVKFNNVRMIKLDEQGG